MSEKPEVNNHLRSRWLVVQRVGKCPRHGPLHITAAKGGGFELPMNRSSTMKRICMITAAALLFLSTAAFGFDLGGTFRLGNLGFTKDRLQTDTTLTGLDFFTLGNMGFSAFASHSPEESSRLEVEYVYDDILRNLFSSLFIYSGNYFSVGVGPFLGFLNAAEANFGSLNKILPNVGISSFFRVELPGAVFASLHVDNTTGNELAKPGDYLQERTVIALGFYVRNAICSLNITNKRFVEREPLASAPAVLQISDLFAEYAFKVDIFQKNIPYRILLSFGLQELKKAYAEAASTTTHTLYSLVVGTRADIEITDFMSLILDLDSSVYTFGYDELLGAAIAESTLGYLFRARVGFSLDMDRILGLSAP